MTKRYGNFDPKNNKKPKLDYDIEALWGEDLDECGKNALEDCIKLATQVCREEKFTCTQLNNVTIFPTYSAFKDRSTIVSSTQVNNDMPPSTSKNTPIQELVNKKSATDAATLEKNLKVFQQKCEEKEGEVAILRSQLQEAKANAQIEQQKIQNEWKQKLNVSEKHMKSVKSELEFKDLEIATLKQKMLCITKRTNNLEVTLNATQSTVAKKIKTQPAIENETKRKPTKIQAILYPVYPLKGIMPNSIFKIPKRDQHIIETKLTHSCRNAIPYLQNQTISATIAVDKSEINISTVYPELLELMYCTEEELNSSEKNAIINKVVCTCEQFLNDLQTFLNQIKNNLRTENILEADSSYLKHQESHCLDEDHDEIGLKAGILLNFIAELFPYSDYLKKYICQNKDLCFQNQETYIKQFIYLADKNHKFRHHYFLNMTLNILRTAGEIRKANVLSNFFCSTIKLLINIVKSRHFDYVSDIFCELTKEIILSRPTVKVICEITFLFKVASQNLSFVEFLFNKSQNSITSKKGVLYFNEDACRFYVFVMLFDNTVFKLKSEYFPKSVCLNMLCFMYNTFQTSNWIHHRDAKECECVPQLYKLEIEIVFMALERYVEEIRKTKKKTSEWIHFFKNGITVKVLSLMTFNSYELTEKYITVFSQYKEIEKKLQEENISELEKLNISEEVIEISSSAFVNIDF